MQTASSAPGINSSQKNLRRPVPVTQPPHLPIVRLADLRPPQGAQKLLIELKKSKRTSLSKSQPPHRSASDPPPPPPQRLPHRSARPRRPTISNKSWPTWATLQVLHPKVDMQIARRAPSSSAPNAASSLLLPSTHALCLTAACFVHPVRRSTTPPIKEATGLLRRRKREVAPSSLSLPQ